MKFVLLIVLSFFCLQMQAKKAYFIFHTLEKQKGEQAFSEYDSLEVKVNGVVLLRDKKQKIKINEEGLDTIKIKNSFFNENVIAKLKDGETYHITFNPCSTFEIIPANKKEGFHLARIVSVNRNESKIYYKSLSSFIDSLEIQSKDTTNYFISHTSGYCPYAISNYSFCSKDIDFAENELNKYCKSVLLYFSGTEMFSIYYDYQSKNINVRFDGYYDKRMNIKIGSESFH
ncbi:MAG: hypothetical protein ACKOXB_14315 [Flavobacteriales bacterium]